ncbi:SIS domain-containing protein [Erwinia tracheiphila]|uniref:Glutamine--fructose-6-phosphate aminotransferase n=1 Tax=Erwinia tracheiphila TaxID=65700 RepID=A0A0M2KIF7_9GAMM|nr:SIS domain-containing protein [Erwinia tracheiphila]AXF77577.1 SIS domain-containing protein [Erwinia tracheiphila]EOS94498.1 glutamine-fructose-6-phosphate transaminase [Erwinia tracheiphila PSU-1]KKF36801.1 glutamine--fructose-6-phosphate aminotransferase [Erwinia tracheiphila]UIA83738.1 SIS domain-containing protein [Erwinia tracheiphila]UIA88142.1 SIS domain-containing protein [Erwinia tracheiphila]
MTAINFSAYEKELVQQVSSLTDQLDYTLPDALKALPLQQFDRIILAGMGSSDYALIPVERELIALGLSVWRIDAGRLLDMPQLVTSQTLLWLTSQSGMSGEIVKVLENITAPRTLIGVTNNAASLLAERADILVELKSGDESTVSAKSYLNTLIANYRTFWALTGQDEALYLQDIKSSLPTFADIIQKREPVQAVTDRLFTHTRPRVALIGMGADAATALTGALITKEASKVSAEGFIGGEFRHGPMETSGKGMLALLLGDGSGVTLTTLASDLADNGTEVITIGPVAYSGSQLLPTPGESTLIRLLGAMLWVQHLTVTLARSNGMVPGEFLYGQKVTVKI